MLSKVPTRLILLVLVLIAAPILRAQFQDPTPDELKMTADPKAPGAAAVFLNFEEDTDDPLHYHSVYARIKVLTEKGKDLATVNVPYFRSSDQITDIKARTIHADGTVIPLAGKPDDLLVAKSGNIQFDRKVFNLPSVEVGSILEYRYQLRYDDNHFSSPLWDIQHEYFVHKARYVFTPFKAFQPGNQVLSNTFLIDEHGDAINTLIWWQRLPPGNEVKKEAPGRFTLTLTDVPPAPNEEWMPPRQSVLYHVNFYYKSANGSADFWASEAKLWSKDVDHFVEPTKTLREVVNGIVTPSDSDLDKAKKIYKAVQALDNTDFSRQKGKTELKQLGLKAAKRADDTWTQKSGSRQDIALLYIAMARAAGLTAYDMKVVDRNAGIFDPGYLSFNQLDDDIVIVLIGGKEIVLDPGEKMCPFQTVNWRHSGAGGVRQSTEGRSVGTSPFQSYTSNTMTRLGDLTLDDHGSVTGSFRVAMSGQEALRWRQEAVRNDLDEVKKSFDRWLQSTIPDGVEAHVDHFVGLDDPDANLIAFVKADGVLGTATSKRLMLPGYFFETRSRVPFVNEEKRLEPIDMHYPEQITDQITLHLPSGMAVEGAPETVRIPWADNAALVTKTVVNPNQIVTARQYSRAFTLLKSDEYENLRDFYKKIAATEQQQLVLTSATAAKGN